MSLYSPIGVGFVHIPKTGGTSIRQWFTKNILKTISYIPNHMRASTLCKRHPDIDFLFTVVRNPWSRIVSKFRFMTGRFNNLAVARERYAQRHEIFKDLKFEEYVDYKKNMSFEYFVNCYIDLKDNKPITLKLFSNDPNYNNTEEIEQDWEEDDPQIKWLDRPMDHIMKLEKINEDFKAIQKLFNCHIDLPITNQHNSKNKDDYKTFYNGHTKKKIAKIFAEDIETFKYKFEE
jgi:hypothetical protein